MNEYDVFISYRRGGDSFTAILLQRQLQSKSKSVFLDVDDIKSGYFDEKLLHTIENTPNFLIILSPGSLDRCIDSDDWVRKEIEHALKTNRNIIPIMMEGFNFNKVNLPESISELKRHNGIPCIHMFFDPMIEKLLTFLKPTTKTENKEETTDNESTSKK